MKCIFNFIWFVNLYRILFYGFYCLVRGILTVYKMFRMKMWSDIKQHISEYSFSDHLYKKENYMDTIFVECHKRFFIDIRIGHYESERDYTLHLTVLHSNTHTYTHTQCPQSPLYCRCLVAASNDGHSYFLWVSELSPFSNTNYWQ